MSMLIDGTSGITFPDATTQTTSATSSTTLGSIGSVVFAIYTGTTNLAAGATAAGSDLRYASSLTVSSSNLIHFTQNTTAATNPYTLMYQSQYAEYRVSGNSGYSPSYFGGTTALSGTWRTMQGVGTRRFSVYDSCGNSTQGNSPMALFVRVS